MTTSSASRLYAFYSKCLLVQPGGTFGASIAKSLGKSRDDIQAIQTAATSMHALADQAIADLTRIPKIDVNLYTKPIRQVQSHFSYVQLANSHANIVTEANTGHLLDLLQIVGNTLEQHAISDGLAEEAIDDHSSKLQTLIQEITSDDSLDETLREFLLDVLGSAIAALQRSKLGTGDQLLKDIESLEMKLVKIATGITDKNPSRSSDKLVKIFEALRAIDDDTTAIQSLYSKGCAIWRFVAPAVLPLLG